MVYKIRFLKKCIQIEFNQQVNKLQFRGDLLILPYTCPQFEARLCFVYLVDFCLHTFWFLPSVLNSSSTQVYYFILGEYLDTFLLTLKKEKEFELANLSPFVS